MKLFFDLKNRIILIIILFIVGIISTTLSMLNWYLEKVTPKINFLVEEKLKKVTYEIITDKINTDLINENNLRDILNITKNEAGEIITVDYNLEKAYTVNSTINNSIINSINSLDEAYLENSEFLLGENSMYINVPLFITSDYAIVSSLGPKIPIKVSFIGTVITNLETRITDYGLNNVLNEIYVNVEIVELITTPVSTEKIYIEYDILIDATMINGRVPSYYGGEIISSSNILDSSLQ